MTAIIVGIWFILYGVVGMGWLTLSVHALALLAILAGILILLAGSPFVSTVRTHFVRRPQA